MRQWTVDAFAAQPFRGNPACVVEPFQAWPDAAWMQALAAENNQAETAFLLKTDDPARFGLRWFTPALEVPLCGHATLASGHALMGELGVTADEVVFDTRSGPLSVRRCEAGYGPLSCSADALPRFVSASFAVGVRLEADDEITVLAPFGLEDLFALRLRPNPERRAAGFARVADAMRARWPELTVEAAA